MARFFDGVIVYCHTFQIASGITHSFSKIFSNKTLILIRPAKKKQLAQIHDFSKDSKGFQRILKDSKGFQRISYRISMDSIAQKDNLMGCHTD